MLRKQAVKQVLKEKSSLVSNLKRDLNTSMPGFSEIKLDEHPTMQRAGTLSHTPIDLSLTKESVPNPLPLHGIYTPSYLAKHSVERASDVRLVLRGDTRTYDEVHLKGGFHPRSAIESRHNESYCVRRHRRDNPTGTDLISFTKCPVTMEKFAKNKRKTGGTLYAVKIAAPFKPSLLDQYRDEFEYSHVGSVPSDDIVAHRAVSDVFATSIHMRKPFASNYPLESVKLIYAFTKKHEHVAGDPDVADLVSDVVGRAESPSGRVVTMNDNETESTSSSARKVMIDDVRRITTADGRTFERNSAKKGTNCGGMFTDTESGKKYYIKYSELTADAADRLQNELLSLKLYQLFGVTVPDAVLIHFENDGMSYVGIASEWQLVMSLGDAQLQSRDDTDAFAPVYPYFRYETQAHFLIDALLANWDVVGLARDNLFVTSDAKPFRLDAGGCLLYRAQGAPKGRLFDSTAKEFSTLTCQRTNKQSHELFGDVHHSASLMDSLQNLKKVSDAQIKQCIEQYGFADKDKNQQLYQLLILRRKSLIAQATMAIHQRLLGPESVEQAKQQIVRPA